MNKIIAPLKLQMQGSTVANLQDGLLLLVKRGLLLGQDEELRKGLTAALRVEREKQIFEKMTFELVGQFQIEQGLSPNGEVDERTAHALNKMLQAWGLLDDGESAPASRIVTGAIRREDGLPLQGMRIRAAHQSEQGPIRLGDDDITDEQGRYTLRYQSLPNVKAINLTVSALSDEGRTLISSKVVDNATALETIDLTVTVSAAASNRQTITGTVVFEHGLLVKELKLRLYRRDFGGTVTLLNETTTVPGGGFVFAFEHGIATASLEVRAVMRDESEILLSAPINDIAGSRTGLNLVIPKNVQPLAAEYKRLSNGLKPHLREMKKLAEAREDAQLQDLTVLNRASGWDARLIALACIAERLAADPEVGLPPEVLYGMLRAGLPSDKLLLAQVDPEVAGMAIKKMRDAGIIDISDADINAVKNKFGGFATRTMLTMQASGSRSTYGELLSAGGLSDGKMQEDFIKLYLKHRGSSAQLWDEARKAGLNGVQIGKLQLLGKLAFLTGNSAAMITQLSKRSKGELQNPIGLVEHDFHRAQTWRNDVFELAGIPPEPHNQPLTEEENNRLNAVIPDAYVAGNAAARLDAYTEDMARKVRLSYPTQVLGRLMETDESFKLPSNHDTTLRLFKGMMAQGFRLGEMPVTTFLKSTTELQGDQSQADFYSAVQGVKALQHVYQITPTNEAMPVLMSLGMTSAFDVMAYPEEQFLTLFNTKYLELYGKAPPAGLPRLISRKVKQVSSITWNLFAIAKKLNSEPPVAGLSAPPEVRESVRNELIRHYPSMESLFGSMDFCECEHCRSVLSPAAYFVDLLQFVDTEPGVWNNNPHKNEAGEALKPYDVLVERRPDLACITLTCENTHTAQPYIDIVNEILEYYVANGKLANDAAHDTGGATTAELLAEPQNVLSEAYNKLRQVPYPLNLPFDLWTETTRQFCQYFETPFHEVLETFRSEDDLFTDGQALDRAAIFMESLGLSHAEAAIFTNPDPLTNDSWQELYGGDTSAVLKSAKALSRCLGVSYKEITDIVQTGFVNPELDKLSVLYKLGISIRDAKLYKDENTFFEANHNLLDKDRSTLSAADQQRYDELGTKRPNRDLTGWEVLNELEAFGQRLTGYALAINPELKLDELPAAIRELSTVIQTIPFERVLVLADPDTGCNFDLTTLQYASGDPADPVVFLRINLFVRLWRKLGWSIEETDRALTTFIPKNTPFDGNPVNLTQQPLRTALIYLAHLKVLDEKLKVGKQSRIKLLTLWSSIGTAGKKSLYAQLFLKRSVLKTSPVFDHPLGLYLADPNILLKDHMLVLQGALGLSADEIGFILNDAGMSPDKVITDTGVVLLEPAELSLANVSLLYRYGLLARALKLSVRELITLRQISGINPFKVISDNPLENLEQDYPFSQTLEFVKVAGEVKDIGLKIDDLDYLLRHQFDKTGKYRSDRVGTLNFLKSLSEGVRAIRAEHPVPDDTSTLSEEVLRQKLGLALSPDVVERFLGMVNTTVEFTATWSVKTEKPLKPEYFASEERISAVSYNKVREEQKLTLRGMLSDPVREEINARFDAVPTATDEQKEIFAELLNKVQKAAREFFDNQLKKQKLRLEGEAGFLDEDDFTGLFSPLEPLIEILPEDKPEEVTTKQDENASIDKQNQETLQQRRNQIAKAFLPFLQQRLIRQLVVQAMTTRTGADPALAESLIVDERLLAAPDTVLNTVAATAQRGLNAKFSVSGAPPFLTDANTSSPLWPVGADSADLEGYLEVPAAGAYRFYIELVKQNAGAQLPETELRFSHLPEPVLVKSPVNDDDATLVVESSEYLELNAGVLYHFSFDVKHLNGGVARVVVQGETMPRGPLSQLTLYPATVIDAAERATTLLSKAIQLVQSTGLSEREIRYLLTHADAFGGFNLNELPTELVGDTTDDAAATVLRFGRFRRLAACARLKRDLAGGTDDLTGIFEANGTTAADRLEKQVYPLIARLTRREEATVKACAEALTKAPSVPDFNSEKPLSRLWEVLQVVEKFGVSPAAIREWTAIANAVTPDQRRIEIARDLKEAIKARFEPEAWQHVAQPIFDKLRQRQRDALVSHVMHQHGFERMEELYEHFLIDPGMEPVVQTSRIRLAISSVQLFIQRCLLNLEPRVHPSAINAKQWEWMKRYRVWEANRKIFLFPENWLEPEFRDDKTHLFTELEGALLQGDVSGDLVEDAFLNYLRKLDELARLDICAMHIEDNSDSALCTLHVFGRTYSQPHKYFYRRYVNQMWTPWEPVNVEIEGDHLAPVVWRDRLYLFWVTFMEKADPPLTPSRFTPAIKRMPHEMGYQPREPKLSEASVSELTGTLMASAGRKTVQAQLHWSEYIQGQWTTQESNSFNATDQVTRSGLTAFDAKQVFVHVSKEYADGNELGVFIHLGGALKSAFYLAGRNSAPVASNYGPVPENKFTSANAPNANRYDGDDALTVSYRERIVTGPASTPAPVTPNILNEGSAYTLLPCNNNLLLVAPDESHQHATDPEAVRAVIDSGLAEIASLSKPVFYQDHRHTLFVEPEVTERTIEEWQEWVIRTPQPELVWQVPGWWENFVVVPEIPRPIPDFTGQIDHGSLINPIPEPDWLINPGSVVRFGDVLISKNGRSGLEIQPTSALADDGALLNINPGSNLDSGKSVVLRDAKAFANSGLISTGGGLNVIGSAGLNSGLAKNLDVMNAGLSGAGRIKS